MSSTLRPPNKLKIGQSAPDFTLPNVDGTQVNLKTILSRAKVVAILFTCNHCPYAQAYESRIKEIQQEFGSRGVQVICMNSNDAVNYPDDSFDAMKERAKSKSLNYPYLRDEDQSVARAFGAEYTPECYLLDAQGVLRYNGRIDDNYANPAAVKDHSLRKALESLLNGQPVASPETHAIGCSIKWK